MSAKLHLAEGLTLPPEAVTQTFAILAKRGGGKTYCALVLAEELLGVKAQVVIADPVGVCWGLRAAANGKDPGLPIVVMGGDHGDVPLEAAAGKVVAEFVVETRQSVVLDLSLLRKGDQVRFMTDFAETLYHRNRAPLHLILDEADAFAPQRPMHGQERMLGAMQDLVRRGRARGIGVTLVTQRAAVLSKDVLTQVEVLVALRTIAPQDREAIDAWIQAHDAHGQRKAFMESLASLPIGTAWFWSPGWLDLFKRVKIRARTTFDSSATPTVGTKAKEPAKLAPVELEQLKVKIAATIERAKQDDPRELRRHLAEVKAELAKVKAAPAPKSTEKRVEVPMLTPGQVKTLERSVERLSGDWLSASIERLERLLGQAKAAAADVTGALRRVQAPTEYDPVRRTIHVPPPLATASRAVARKAPAEGLTEPQRRIIDTVAMLNARGIEADRESVARWLGIHPNGGSYGANLGHLRGAGYLEGFVLTELGQRIARPQETGLEAALRALDGEPKRQIVRTLVDAGRPLSREELAEKLGLHPNGGSYGANLGWLRTMGIITARGLIAPTDGLFQ